MHSQHLKCAHRRSEKNSAGPASDHSMTSYMGPEKWALAKQPIFFIVFQNQIIVWTFSRIPTSSKSGKICRNTVFMIVKYCPCWQFCYVDGHVNFNIIKVLPFMKVLVSQLQNNEILFLLAFLLC